MVHTWAPYLETVVVSRALLGAIASVIEWVSDSATSSKNKGRVVGVRAVGTCVK
jgi:hypothetical protein